ncbi:MAG: SH3 domain-containing protein [Methylobacteriaceae bacterium]|nr:SH3 domain-containing protein [Methylobacteriaceae bacterium]
MKASPIFRTARLAACLVLSTSLACGASLAKEESRTVRLTFKDGRASASDAIRGYEYVDYVFPAGASESLEVELKTANTATYFNLLAPGQKEVAFFIGSTSGKRFAGKAPSSGDYTARVYMMRSAARRGEKANFRLAITLGETRATNEKGPDFADGLTGGPDYWAVSGVKAGDSLNLREDASPHAKIVARFSNGTVLRNLGCKNAQGQRWCRVERADVAGQRGWVNGRHLRESAAPAR